MGQAIISEVIDGSLAEELGLIPGDRILKINNHDVEDLIQFQYLWANEEIALLIKKRDGQEVLFEIEKEYDEGLGAIFEQAVFDKIITCHNNCLFCFIQQMAPFSRASLYDKDDDYRLSFLQGNFITLTNLDNKDFARIKEEKLSPLYVSVHTTDPDLRVKLLNNPNGGKIMDQLKELIANDIAIHAQVVLCPGINDGYYLEKTINELAALWPGVLSLAVVPVGVTKYRKNLDQFPPINKEYAQSLVRMISQKQAYYRNTFGNTFVFLADEIYIHAGLDFPKADEYEEFPQIENGIGMGRLFLQEFDMIKNNLPEKISTPKKYLLVTGELGQYVIKPVIDRLQEINGLNIDFVVIKNDYFGPRVTVTGLLVGRDLVAGLKNKVEGHDEVIISDIMLKQGEDLFLDDMELSEVAKTLNTKITVIKNSPQALVQHIFGK